MSWEDVERWPGERGGGGAFRGSAEPALAERAGPGLLERFWLFWHSTPEQPVAHAAKKAILTQAYLYVQRFDGRRRRVARERLHGVRRTRHRVLIGVSEDDDLVLPHRPGCALQRQLIDGLSPGAGAAWAANRHVGVGIFAALLCGGVASTFIGASLADAQAAGDLFSDGDKSFYVGLVVALIGLASLLWIPRWVRVDRLGVEVRRGAVPWLVFFAPREEVVGARVRKRVVKTKSQTRHSWVAELELRSPRRLGTLRAEKWVELGETNVARYDKADAMSRRAIEVLGIQPSQRNSTT